MNTKRVKFLVGKNIIEEMANWGELELLKLNINSILNYEEDLPEDIAKELGKLESMVLLFENSIGKVRRNLSLKVKALG